MQAVAQASEGAVSKKKRKKRRAAELAAAESATQERTTKAGGSKKVLAVSDAELAQVYKFVSLGKSASALGLIEALLNKAPNHKLLHLLRADVLTIMSQGTRASVQNNVSTPLVNLSAPQQQQLSILQQEAWLRLNSQANHAKASDVTLVPKPLIKLADNEPYALVVDSKLSRLYVYQNIPNASPKLLVDYYVTQGALGVLKAKEGDSRTPIGAYFIDRPIEQKLPDFYGYGALNIDYPNAWDKRLGRTRHGIWLHGTPSDTYARAPYASNGCVVLANPDMEAIFKLPRAGAMPIVLVDKLDWVPASALEAQRKQLMDTISQWTTAGGYQFTNFVAIEYPNEAGMVLTRFDLVDAKQKIAGKKEVYLRKEAKQWKIVIDNNL
jgi:L,D-transpeptidase catalytic domain